MTGVVASRPVPPTGSEPESTSPEDKISRLEEQFEEYRSFEEFIFNISEKDKQKELKRRQRELHESVNAAIAEFPNPPTSLVHRGLVDYWKGRLLFYENKTREARDQLISAVKLNPCLEFAWIILGETYLKDQELDQARYCFEECLNFLEASKLSLIQLSKLFRSANKNTKLRDLELSHEQSLQRAREALKLD